MPLTAHLDELRRRLVISVVAVMIGFGASYYFAPRMFEVLMAPLVEALPPESTLIFTGVTEAFFTYLKVALLAGFFLASPLVLYQVWVFVSPGLYRHEAKYVIPFVLSSSLLFIGGALFGYFVVFPYGFKFLLGFGTEVIRPMPSIKEYFSLASRLLLAFGAVFELPVFVAFLSKMGLVSSNFLITKFKYSILAIFALSAILTPPDVATQMMMAGPLLALYGVSIIIAFLFEKKKAEKEKKMEEEWEDTEEEDIEEEDTEEEE
jgi:sec-independent protein translocase protein TatC